MDSASENNRVRGGDDVIIVDESHAHTHTGAIEDRALCLLLASAPYARWIEGGFATPSWSYRSIDGIVLIGLRHSVYRPSAN